MHAIRSIPLLAIACTLACSGDDPFDEPLERLAPVGTNAGIVIMDLTHDEAVFVTPTADRLNVERLAVGTEQSRARWAVALLDGTGILVLTAPETDKDEDVEEELHLLGQDGELVRSWEVHAPFTHVALSPDLARAVLYFGGDSGTGALQNANQVAIVDLARDDARLLTLDGFGGQVRTIEFPGARTPGQPGLVDVGGRARDIVAFLAQGEVVLLDAADPAADQVAVRFGDAAFEPVSSMLRPPNEMFDAPALFVRGTGLDVAMLTLVDKPDETTGVSGFSTQVSLIPIGAQTTDFGTFDGEAAPYLLSVGGSDLVFTDIRTQQSFRVGLEAPATHLRQRDHETPLGPVRQAIAWTDQGAAIHTLELDGVEDTLGRAPRHLGIETGIEDLVTLDNDRVLVGSGNNLYVVDISREQVTPLVSAVPYDPRASALVGDQLLLGTAGQDRLSTVDLSTLDPESMVLDAPIESFHHLPASGQALVVHPDSAGFITIADAESPSRGTSFTTWGVLLEGVL